LDAALVALLRDGVLTEWQPTESNRPHREILSFSHKILFDYAAAVLLFRGLDDGLHERMRSDSALALICRSSIALHLHHLWEVDRNRFWSVVFAIAEDESIPVVGRLIGPMTLVDLCSEIADLEPLTEQLSHGG
jgi:hypothetical protein